MACLGRRIDDLVVVLGWFLCIWGCVFLNDGPRFEFLRLGCGLVVDAL